MSILGFALWYQSGTRCAGVSENSKMFLPAHGVCLDEPRLELVVEVIHSSEPESVEVIAGRERLDPPKPRGF